MEIRLGEPVQKLLLLGRGATAVLAGEVAKFGLVAAFLFLDFSLPKAVGISTAICCSVTGAIAGIYLLRKYKEPKKGNSA